MNQLFFHNKRYGFPAEFYVENFHCRIFITVYSKEDSIHVLLGVLLGQHIPSLRTKLELDKNIIAQYGPYGTSLSNANDLIQQNITNQQRRTGKTIFIEQNIDNYSI